jgi:hypothetical protein
MLAKLLLAGSMIAAPLSAGRDGGSAGDCPSIDILMGAYKAEPAKPAAPDGERLLPTPRPEGKTPAVLLPECRSEPPKRRKRKNDYPLA